MPFQPGSKTFNPKIGPWIYLLQKSLVFIVPNFVFRNLVFLRSDEPDIIVQTIKNYISSSTDVPTNVKNKALRLLTVIVQTQLKRLEYRQEECVKRYTGPTILCGHSDGNLEVSMYGIYMSHFPKFHICHNGKYFST